MHHHVVLGLTLIKTDQQFDRFLYDFKNNVNKILKKSYRKK